MTEESKELNDGKQEGLIYYRPVTSKIRSLIASQEDSSEEDGPLQKNAELISRCLGTVPKNQFEQDWKELVTAILHPGQELIGIGACTGPNDVKDAVKEALSDPLMDKDLLRSSSKVVVGIIGGPGIDDKTVARISNLVSKRTSRQDIHIKVIIYDEMEEILSVLIMARR